MNYKNYEKAIISFTFGTWVSSYKREFCKEILREVTPPTVNNKQNK